MVRSALSATVVGVAIGVGLTGLSLLMADTSAQAEDAAHQADRQAVAVSLRRLGIAMHNYHHDYGSLPSAAISDKAGKPMLSWRVALLPYLEEAELYKQFKLDEPWDSDHNQKLLEKMPVVFLRPGPEQKEKHGTCYQLFVSTGSPFEKQAKPTLPDITLADGTSRTIMIAEAATAVPWTKPVDLAWVDQKPRPKLGGLVKDQFHICFFDCSVRRVQHSIPDKFLRLLIGVSDGWDDEIMKSFVGQDH